MGISSIIVLAALGLIADLFSDGFGNVGKILLLIAALAILGTVFYVDFHRPLIITEREARSQLLEQFLLALFWEQVTFGLPDDVQKVTRVNVMVMKYFLFIPRFMTIHYSYGDNSGTEAAMRWEPNEGCCGCSFDWKEQLIFDRVEAQQTELNMKADQLSSTEEVHCVLRKPIFRGADRTRDPIDSRHEITLTSFKNPDVQDRCDNLATVGTVL